MWLENNGCICKECNHEYNPETKQGCKDCRLFRDIEKILAHSPSILSGKHDIKFEMRIAKCPRFVEKPEQFGSNPRMGSAISPRSES